MVRAGLSRNIAWLAVQPCCCLMEVVHARFRPAPILSLLAQDRSMGVRDFRVWLNRSAWTTLGQAGSSQPSLCWWQLRVSAICRFRYAGD